MSGRTDRPNHPVARQRTGRMRPVTVRCLAWLLLALPWAAAQPSANGGVDAAFDVGFAVRLAAAVDHAASVAGEAAPAEAADALGFDWALVDLANGAEACPPPEHDCGAGAAVRYRVLIAAAGRVRAFVTTADGTVEGVTDATASDAPVRLDTPAPHGTVTSPVAVVGAAAGWYFEGSFGADLYTPAGEVLAQHWVEATDDWMTSDFVPFRGKLAFEVAGRVPAVLVLERANPSGLAVFAAYYLVPVELAGTTK